MSVGFALMAAIRLLLLGYDRLRQRVREVELRAERARHQALKAELQALQSRTDPHFLFNSFNTLAGLIEEDPQRAVEVVTKLAAFFRHNVQASRSDRVAFGDELRAASAYLEIQALRLGPRLSWSVATDPTADTTPVPALLLQPLVENAVVHGASIPGRATRVEVRAERVDDRLWVTVDDDGPGPGGSRCSGAGSSLRDIAERLELLFGARAAMQSGPSPLGGFRARLLLPTGDTETGVEG